MDNALKSIDFLKHVNSSGALLLCGLVAVVTLNRKSFFSKTVISFLQWTRVFLEDLFLSVVAVGWIFVIVGFPQSVSMIYKWCIGVYLRLKFGKLATTIDCLDVIGTVESDAAPVTITSLKVLHGVCDLADLRHRILATVSKKNEHGDLTFPKFYQTLEQVSGYSCWKPAKFDIKHHVRFLDRHHLKSFKSGKSYSESSVLKMTSAVAKNAFHRSRSPWEVLVVPNFHYDYETAALDKGEAVPPKFAIVIRIHHAIGDGYSFLKLIVRDTHLAGDPKVNCPVPATPKRPGMPLWKGALVFVYLTLRATRALLVEMLSRDDNPLFGEGSRTLSGETVLVWSQPMKLEFLKQLKKKTGVGLTTVFLTALTSSVRKYINEDFRVEPKLLSAVIPFPAPNHPDNRMTNKFSFIRFPLPCSEVDEMKSLKEMEKQSRKSASAPDGPLNLFLLQLVGILPTVLVRAFLSNKQSTLVVSNLPGPAENISIWGRDLVETMFWLPPLGKSGISASFLSYTTQFRLGIAVDTGVISDGHAGAQRLIDGFMKSISIMASSVDLPFEQAFFKNTAIEQSLETDSDAGSEADTSGHYSGSSTDGDECFNSECCHGACAHNSQSDQKSLRIRCVKSVLTAQ